MRRLGPLHPYFCDAKMPTRLALGRLNATEHLFQLVIGPGRRLLGTLTDGDIRRALLRGVSLEAPVSECMHVRFKAGQAGAEAANQAILEADDHFVMFLPVLDAAGVVVDVLLRSPNRATIEHALVMAGGFGRRLGDRTKSTPKPLLPVGGRPILDHVLGTLEKSGVRTVYVSVHYHAEQIRSYVGGRDNRFRAIVVEEDHPMGTAGALGRLGDLAGAPIMVVNGDVITGADLGAMHDFHIRHGLDATVGVARHDIDVPFGLVRYGPDGLFDGIDEKPRISNFIAAGLYYLSTAFPALVPADRPIDMPELLNTARKIGLKIGLFPIHEYWADVGRPIDLEAAEGRHPADAQNGAPAVERGS